MVSSKYYLEKHVVYEKAEVVINIDDASNIEQGRFEGVESPEVSLPLIDGKWKFVLDPVESNCLLELNTLFNLEVKDCKLLKLFSAKAKINFSWVYGGYTDRDSFDNYMSSDLFEIYENSMEMTIEENYDVEELDEYAPYLIVKGEMEILYKRKFKNDNLKKINLDKHWNALGSSAPVTKKQKLQEDFAFIVQGQKIKVNKAQMASANDKMKLIFQDGTETAEINSIDVDSFKLLLSYLKGAKESFKRNFKVYKSFDLFQASREFQAKPLMDFCMARIFENFTGINNVVATYEFACQHDIEDLKIFCWEVIQFDIMKFFHAMDPLSVEKVKKFVSTKEEVHEVLSECYNDVFSTIRLDEDRKRAVLEKYVGQKM